MAGFLTIRVICQQSRHMCSPLLGCGILSGNSNLRKNNATANFDLEHQIVTSVTIVTIVTIVSIVTIVTIDYMRMNNVLTELMDENENNNKQICDEMDEIQRESYRLIKVKTQNV